MYLWKTKELVSKMKSNEISQTEKFKYFLVFVILGTISKELSSYISYTLISPSFQAVIASILTTVIVISGTFLCYKTNKNGDDKEFIDRFFCISLPIGIKFFVILFITLFLYSLLSIIILRDAFNPQVGSRPLAMNLILIFYLVCFYWRLMHHLKIVSSK